MSFRDRARFFMFIFAFAVHASKVVPHICGDWQ